MTGDYLLTQVRASNASFPWHRDEASNCTSQTDLRNKVSFQSLKPWSQTKPAFQYWCWEMYTLGIRLCSPFVIYISLPIYDLYIHIYMYSFIDLYLFPDTRDENNGNKGLHWTKYYCISKVKKCSNSCMWQIHLETKSHVEITFQLWPRT